MSVYYSEFLFAFSFSFKQRVILSSSLLVSTVSSTLSFHSPFLFLFHSFFFFLHLFLFWRSIVTPYTLSLTFSLSSRQRARQISNPHSQFMTLFFHFFSPQLACAVDPYFRKKLTHFVPVDSLPSCTLTHATTLHKIPCNNIYSFRFKIKTNVLFQKKTLY